jgi:hypothetical protein
MALLTKKFHRCTQKAIDRVLDGNQEGKTYTRAWNQGDFQRWAFEDVGNGYYKIKQRATGRVLDGNGAGETYTLIWNEGDNQRWKIDDLGDGCFRITQKATGRVLDGNKDGKTYTLEWNGGGNQRWQLDTPQVWNQVSDIFLNEFWTDEVQGVAYDGNHWFFSCNANQVKPGHKEKSIYVFKCGESLKDNAWKSQFIYQDEVIFPIAGTTLENSHWG